uniref:BDLF2 n=1 Tax=Epstein-Barr virus (strain GD1) TaxID=10376 RepID=A0A2S1MY68_EBVG|nr:BDLF2 [human gammaherpesvirus 4]
MVDEQVAVEHGTVSHTISREEDGVVHERRVLASGERVEVFYKAPAPRPREGRASTFHDFTVPAAAAVPGPEPEPEPHPPMPIHANGGGETKTNTQDQNQNQTTRTRTNAKAEERTAEMDDTMASSGGQRGAPISADLLSLSSLTGRMAAMAPSWMKSEVCGERMRFKEDVYDGEAETLAEPPRCFMLSFVFIYYCCYLAFLALLAFGFNPLFLPSFMPVGAKVLRGKGRDFGVPLSYGCPTNPFCKVYTLIPAVVINNVTYYPNNTDSHGGHGGFEAAALHVAALFESGCPNLQAVTNRNRTFNVTRASGRVERRLVQDMQRVLASAVVVMHHHCHYETYYVFDGVGPEFGTIPTPCFKDVLAFRPSLVTNCTTPLKTSVKGPNWSGAAGGMKRKQCRVDRLTDRSFPAYLEEVMYVMVQ